jgi:hypothetical protein
MKSASSAKSRLSSSVPLQSAVVPPVLPLPACLLAVAAASGQPAPASDWQQLKAANTVHEITVCYSSVKYITVVTVHNSIVPSGQCGTKPYRTDGGVVTLHSICDLHANKPGCIKNLPHKEHR